MSRVIMETTATESLELDRGWDGFFQVICEVYGTAVVKLQKQVDTSTWIDLRFNGKVIQFEAAGDVLDVWLARNFTYRWTTATAGAKLVIAQHYPHGE